MRAQLEDTTRRLAATVAAERDLKMLVDANAERWSCAEADLRQQKDDAIRALRECELSLEEARREAAEYKRQACEAIQRESAKAMAVQLAMEDHMGVANARVAEAEKVTARWREAHEIAMDAAKKSRLSESEAKRKLAEAIGQVATAQRRQLAQAERDHQLYANSEHARQEAISQSTALVRSWTEAQEREARNRKLQVMAAAAEQLQHARLAATNVPIGTGTSNWQHKQESAEGETQTIAHMPGDEQRVSMGAEGQTGSWSDQATHSAVKLAHDTLRFAQWSQSSQPMQAAKEVGDAGASRRDDALQQPAQQAWVELPAPPSRPVVAFGSTTRNPKAIVSPPVPACAGASNATQWTSDMSHPSMPSMLSMFVACFNVGAKDDPNDKSARAALFRRFSSTGRGYISLAETCTGILSALSGMHGQEAPAIYRRY